MALIPESGRSPGEKWKLLSHVQPRLPTPWHSPGENTGVGSVSLLQGISPTQGSNPGIPHCKWIFYQLSYQGRPALPGEGNDNPLQYSCLENPTDRGAWWAIVHGVTNSWAQLSKCAHMLAVHKRRRGKPKHTEVYEATVSVFLPHHHHAPPFSRGLPCTSATSKYHLKQSVFELRIGSEWGINWRQRASKEWFLWCSLKILEFFVSPSYVWTFRLVTAVSSACLFHLLNPPLTSLMVPQC